MDNDINNLFNLFEKQVVYSLKRHNEFPDYIWTSTGATFSNVLDILILQNKRIKELENKLDMIIVKIDKKNNVS